MLHKIVMSFGCFFCCFAIYDFTATYWRWHLTTHRWSPYFIGAFGALLIYLADQLKKTEQQEKKQAELQAENRKKSGGEKGI